MDQARYYVCESCMTPVPSGHKFCGRCGEPVPEDKLAIEAQYFSDMQDPSKARLILVHGDGMDGLSYHLKAEQHLLGKSGQVEFPDDPFVSAQHANFFYNDGQLLVRDEGSLNGVYFRVRQPAPLKAGDTFVVGQQLLQVDAAPVPPDAVSDDGTYYYASPTYQSGFMVTQLLEGGAKGISIRARGAELTIGREDCDLNFHHDSFISPKHCTVTLADGQFVLTDHETKNGSYVRIQQEHPLGHGDYLFIGRKLMRVELNP